VTLTGTIEHKKDSKSMPDSFAIYLNLMSRVCIEARNSDGAVLKLENTQSIQLGISNLNKALRPGDRVSLRGELWGPVRGESADRFIFSVESVQ
jgi:hypothetical protein